MPAAQPGIQIMDLYRVKETTLSSIHSEEFKLERDLQQLVEANLEILFGLTLVTSEFSLGEFRLDTLAYDAENKAFVIIEYKKKHNASVIDQGYSYLSLMLNNKSDCILEFNEKQDGKLKRVDIDWSSSRVLFVSTSFNKFQRNSVNFKDIPFELWEVRRFANNIISVSQIQATSNESIRQIAPNQDASIIRQVSSEINVSSESDHLGRLSPAMQEVWKELKDNIEGWPDNNFNARRNYIGFRRGNKTACYIYFQRHALRIAIRRGKKTEDGQPGESFFNLEDYKGIAEESSWKYQDGKTESEYSIKLKSLKDIPYVRDLIRQKYETI